MLGAPNSKKQYLDITCKNLDVSKGNKGQKAHGKLKNLTETKEIRELLEGMSSSKPIHQSSDTTAAQSRNTQTPVKTALKKNWSQTPSKRAKEEDPDLKSGKSTKVKSISRNLSVNKSAAALRTPPIPVGLRSTFKSNQLVTQMPRQPKQPESKFSLYSNYWT